MNTLLKTALKLDKKKKNVSKTAIVIHVSENDLIFPNSMCLLYVATSH